MVTTHRNMLSAIIIALIVLGIELIIGSIANGLMIIVNCLEWIRSRKLTRCDMILTSLGISRFFLQCMIFINSIVLQLCQDINRSCDTLSYFFVVWMYLSTLSLWFATWLSVFYCVKIATFSQPLFLWLRQKISGLLPQLLLSSLLVSLLTCFPSVNTVYRNSSMNNLSGNTTVESKCVIDLFSGLSMFSTIGFYSPFIIFIVSSALLITSLWKHSKRMRKAMSSSKDTITEAHVRAIKGLISFIFFYSSYFAVLVVFLIELFRNDFGFLLLWGVIMAAYPSGHSVILVLGNPKLKKVAVKALHYALFRLRNEVS